MDAFFLHNRHTSANPQSSDDLQELDYLDGDNMDYIGGTSDLGSINADKVMHNKIVDANVVEAAVRQIRESLRVDLSVQRVESLGGLFRTSTIVPPINIPVILAPKNLNRRAVTLTFISGNPLTIGKTNNISQAPTTPWQASSDGFNILPISGSGTFRIETVEVIWGVISLANIPIGVLEEIIPSP